MDPSSIVIIVIALAASAFFSGMEIAFVTANRLKIELDSQKGTFSGKILSNFVKHDSRFIATMLLGNNIALVVYGIWMAKLLEPSISDLVYGNEALILTIQTIISALLILFTAKSNVSNKPKQSFTSFIFPIGCFVYSALPTNDFYDVFE